MSAWLKRSDQSRSGSLRDRRGRSGRKQLSSGRIQAIFTSVVRLEQFIQADVTDEPFNVWRIALRRALSANARSAQELPEYGKENLTVSPDGVE